SITGKNLNTPFWIDKIGRPARD
ncbi:hypothetical protein VCHENC02_0597B, partial [Vibrio harveyi]